MVLANNAKSHANTLRVRRALGVWAQLLRHAVYQLEKVKMTSVNSERHVFSFEGGDQLTTIGATFLVSYLYHQHIDSAHNN